MCEVLKTFINSLNRGRSGRSVITNIQYSHKHHYRMVLVCLASQVLQVRIELAKAVQCKEQHPLIGVNKNIGAEIAVVIFAG